MDAVSFSTRRRSTAGLFCSLRQFRHHRRTSCRFEQAFSDDGGKTWEVNWIATDTRAGRGAGEGGPKNDAGFSRKSFRESPTALERSPRTVPAPLNSLRRSPKEVRTP